MATNILLKTLQQFLFMTTLGISIVKKLLPNLYIGNGFESVVFCFWFKQHLLDNFEKLLPKLE